MGAFIAKQDIPVGGVKAYTWGQRVEADAVEANGWQDYVVGEGTKEAREIKAEITGRDPGEFESKSTARSAAPVTTAKQEG